MTHTHKESPTTERPQTQRSLSHIFGHHMVIGEGGPAVVRCPSCGGRYDRRNFREVMRHVTPGHKDRPWLPS